MVSIKSLAITAAALVGAASALPLERRAFSGRATYYAVGLGNCGGYNSGNEYVVALNTAQYGSTSQRSQYCGRQLGISYGGKTLTATVVDSCPTCGYGDLDMSEGLFSALTNGNMGMGQMTVSWDWAGSNSGSQQKQAAAATTTKAAYTPPATSAAAKSSYSPKPSPSSSSSSAEAKSSSSSSSSSNTKTSTAASSSILSGTIASQNVTGVPSWWAVVGTEGCPNVVVPSNQTAVAIAPSNNTANLTSLADACGRSVTIVNNENGLNISAVVTTWIPGGEENSIALADGYKLLANVSSDATPGAIANATWGFAPASNKTEKAQTSN